MIPVNQPVLSPQAKANVRECLRTGWISSAGRFIPLFEEKFAYFLGVEYASAVSNGTTALHLAIVALGIGKGDEVIVPNLTIISCALAVSYCGATPVFVDVDSSTGNIDPAKIEEKITPRTKAIMVVHLYGHPADMDRILLIAKKHKLLVIEDAAEAHGALYKGKKAGSFGDIATFSFYANKIVTTGEGGMVVTNNKKIDDHIKTLRDLAHSPHRRFFHEEIGFNYRLTNMQAALGVGELEHIARYIKKKRDMAARYWELLSLNPYIELPVEERWATSVYWMYAVKMKKDAPVLKEIVRDRLKKAGVDTRNFFIPLSEQPLWRNEKIKKDVFPVSHDLSLRGFYLPSGLALTDAQIKTVAHKLMLACLP